MSEMYGDVEPGHDGLFGDEDDTGCCGDRGVNGFLEPVEPATQPLKSRLELNRLRWCQMLVN